MKRVPEDLATKLLEASNAMPPGTGFDFGIDEVAKLAGVPRATLYYYFSGKDDLVEFYLNDLLERSGAAVRGAAAAEGTVVERLEATMTELLKAFAAYPRMCVELPEAVREIQEHAMVMASIERAVFAPLRELLIQGRATRELVVADVQLATVALLGGLHLVAMMQIVTTGRFDADATARAIVPQLMRGLLPR